MTFSYTYVITCFHLPLSPPPPFASLLPEPFLLPGSPPLLLCHMWSYVSLESMYEEKYNSLSPLSCLVCYLPKTSPFLIASSICYVMCVYVCVYILSFLCIHVCWEVACVCVCVCVEARSVPPRLFFELGYFTWPRTYTLSLSASLEIPKGWSVSASPALGT